MTKPIEADKELDELALEIMNATGGKYTDEQEEKMLQAIIRFRDKAVVAARIDELKRLKNIDAFNEAYTLDPRPAKLVDIRLNQLGDIK